ncbi:MAG TPA: Ger(x)C family spore germination C-terminal domain-containing protein, partial [Clostridia bacterium]|nr:Ger(x)C family spore germination C-terminal domain-containing protein [Clostridia bacterium]
ELKRNLEHRIAEDIARAVYDSQKVYRTDYMSFCIPFRIKYPVEFREMDWHGAFPDADITIEVAVNLDVEGEPDFIPQYEF